MNITYLTIASSIFSSAAPVRKRVGKAQEVAFSSELNDGSTSNGCPMSVCR